MTDIKRISTKTDIIKDNVKEELKETPLVPMMASHMTPDYICGKLFSLYVIAHFYHFQTDNHATHKALDHLYERLVHLNDEISEFLLGKQLPRRFDYIVLDEVKPYNETALLNFLDTGCAFANSLCEYADGKGKGWEALEDMAGNLCKEFTHTKLLISYK
jgi:hypothetical protein